MKPDDYLETARALTARQTFDASCPFDLHPGRTDWNHPDLEPYSRAIAQVRGWTPATHDGKGLLLSGPTGRGKSRAYYSLADRLMCGQPRHDVKMFHAHDFFCRLQAEVRYGVDEASGFVEAVAGHEFLFLDDFGQQALLNTRTEWAEAWFFRLLELRLGAKLPLFITTNLTAVEIAGSKNQLRSDPFLRRLLELCAVVKF